MIDFHFYFQEWFSHRIREFSKSLSSVSNNSDASNGIGAVMTQSEGTMKVLENIAIEFEEISNTCLLVLHLEVRVQCFHYLRSNEKNVKFQKLANDSLEPDNKVLKLTKVLSEMDEALNATLHPRKTKVNCKTWKHSI